MLHINYSELNEIFPQRMAQKNTREIMCIFWTEPIKICWCKLSLKFKINFFRLILREVNKQ